LREERGPYDVWGKGRQTLLLTGVEMKKNRIEKGKKVTKLQSSGTTERIKQNGRGNTGREKRSEPKEVQFRKVQTRKPGKLGGKRAKGYKGRKFPSKRGGVTETQQTGHEKKKKER